MKIEELPKVASWMSTDVNRELSSIEAIAQWHIKRKADFAKLNGYAALILKDEHFQADEFKPNRVKLSLKRCWYRSPKKFHSGDKIIAVNSSRAKRATVLKLTQASNRLVWLRLRVPSNLFWFSLIIEEIDIPGDDLDENPQDAHQLAEHLQSKHLQQTPAEQASVDQAPVDQAPTE